MKKRILFFFFQSKYIQQMRKYSSIVIYLGLLIFNIFLGEIIKGGDLLLLNIKVIVWCFRYILNYHYRNDDLLSRRGINTL